MGMIHAFKQPPCEHSVGHAEKWKSPQSGICVPCKELCVCDVFVCNSSAGFEEEAGGNSRQRHNRHGRDGAPGSLEKRMEELEKVCSQINALLPL